MPAVPATDDFSFLDKSFAEGKPQVGADVFNRVKTALPLEQGDADPAGLYTDAKAFSGELFQACNPYPFVHDPDDILQTLNLARPSRRTRSQDRT